MTSGKLGFQLRVPESQRSNSVILNQVEQCAEIPLCRGGVQTPPQNCSTGQSGHPWPEKRRRVRKYSFCPSHRSPASREGHQGDGWENTCSNSAANGHLETIPGMPKSRSG